MEPDVSIHAEGKMDLTQQAAGQRVAKSLVHLDADEMDAAVYAGDEKAEKKPESRIGVAHARDVGLLEVVALRRSSASEPGLLAAVGSNAGVAVVVDHYCLHYRCYQHQ